MSSGSKVLVVLVVASLGVWGCAQGPANSPASAERIRTLETKLNKLEDDFRAAVAVRDQLRKRVNNMEEECAQLSQQVEQLQLAVKDREELKKQLIVRTTERDNAQTQFEQLRKGIKSLLGQAEPVHSQPVTSAGELRPGGKS